MRLLPLIARRSSLIALLITTAAPAATVDYLAIEANEGGSAGGHVALRLDDAVFHLQHDDDGLLRLRRDPVLVFRVRYALLENRPVHVTRFTVPDAVADTLRSGLARRLLIEGAERERLAALDGDVALFAVLARRAAGDPTAAWPVRGAGYFVADPLATAPAGSPAVATVRARLAAAHGADFLPRRTAAVRAELAALHLHPVPRRPAGDAPGDLPDPMATISTRVTELLEQRTALEVLAAAPPLRADALAADPGAPPLGRAERAALAATAARMTAGLAALPASSRPDWGYPLLLGLARLAAIEASLAADRLLVLDAWPADAPAPPLPPASQRAGFFAALVEQSAAIAARDQTICLGGPSCREADYTRLETALNRRAEVGRALHAGAAPRVGADPLLPARPAARRDLGLAPLGSSAVDAAVRAARRAAADYRAALAARGGYQLVTRNCATELLALLDASRGRAANGGGTWRPPWQAIPFVSAAAVADDFPVVARETWASFRTAVVAADWTAQLAETSPATASRYRPSGRDSTFLFFTDGAVAARPLLGAANLAVGLADGALGLATWPFDDARRLRGGLLGALYSLPELVFVNLRKGTTAYVTSAELAALADSPASEKP